MNTYLKLNLTSVFLIALIAMFGITELFIASTQKVASERETAAENMARISFTHQVLVTEFASTNEDRPKEQWYALDRDLSTLMTQAAPLFQKGSFASTFQSLDKSRLLQQDVFNALVDAISQNRNSEYIDRLKSQMIVQGQQRIVEASHLITLSDKDKAKKNQEANLLIDLLGLFSLLISFFIFLTNRSIRSALERLREGTEEMLKGNLTHRISMKTNDEFGQLANVFNKMVARIQESQKNLEQKIEERTNALSESNIFLDSIIENIPNMIFVKDAKELRFVRFNKAGEDLLGYERNDLIGKNDYDFFPKTEADFFTTKDRGTLESGVLLDIPEEPIQTKYKGARLLHTKKLPIFDINHQPKYLLGISEDITERIKATQELEAFTYSVSHDLRAPLRAIDGFSKILQEETEGILSDEGKHDLIVIRQNAVKMGQLIDDLLMFSRTGKQELKRQPFDMNACVSAVYAELKILEPDRHIKIHIGDLLPAMGDSAMLRQVWLNYLSNAIKYTRKKDIAQIEIESERKNGESVYSIKDNGVGFDMKYLDKLFGVFQRLHAESEFEGTGIGLANVKRIIERHGGRVWAEGEKEKGATFYFSLPDKT